jgi:non-ribosomal peptide synthetase component F/acyl carrier protein
VGRGKALFDTIVVFENYPVDQGLRERAGCFKFDEVTDFDVTHYGLELRVFAGAEMTLDVIYRARQFATGSVNRFAEHLVRILEGMGEGEQKRIGEISILSGEERRQIVEEWNRTGEDWSESGKKSFIELFEEQVKRRGEREAIADGQQRVSYRELDEQSERVGDYLEQRAGVGRGELVGMLGERGVNFVVGMVGILKMGGVYVPLDPRHPVQRWRQVVQESGMRWMVVSGEMAARVRESEVLEETGVQMIVLEEMLQGGEEERTEGWRGEEGAVDGKEEKKQRRSKGGKELAYVIYTSGSTGVPKGAMVEEAGMVNHLRAKVGELEMGAEDVVAQTAVQSFDISVWQMLAPLVSGGRVVVVGEGEAEEPERLMARLEGEGVTIFETVPAMLQAMVSTVASRREESRDGDGKEREAREREAREEERSSRGEEQPPRDRHHRPQAPFELRKLRWVIVTGEAFTTELWRRWQELYPGMKMMNAYGPTECSDDVTHYRIEGRGREKGEAGAEGEGEAEPQGLYVGIGRPIANTEIYILDEEMEPVPVGVGGEIYVGGEGVGRGYVKRAELTAERFVPNRFSRKAGERLYRTGDLGRYRRDGVVEFLGRVDQQVKVRGYRIELGEIEGVLGKHERVEQAAVVVREDERGEKRLVGYVVRKVGNGEVSREDLRRYMQERLPEYMVPSQVVFMAEMPLTGSGKVDRKQLPKPEVRRGEEEGETGDRYVAPRNEVEEILCGIWAEVLGVERVGIEDNFFQLGGHSLSATRVVSRMRKIFDVEIPLRTFFVAPTVAATAGNIIELRKSDAVSRQIALTKVDRSKEVPLSFAQQRLWFIDQLDPGSPLYNISARIAVEGPLNAQALESSLHMLFNRHEILRTTFVQSGHNGTSHPIQVIQDKTKKGLEVIDLSAFSEDERDHWVHKLARSDGEQPFDLTQGPLLRAKLLRLEDQRHILLVSMHHIVSDGWSMGILVKELVQCYEAFAAGQTPSLADLPIQYADYSVWQREWLRGETLEKHLAYWKEQLSSVTAYPSLPTDRPRLAESSHQGASHDFKLSREVTEKLKKLGRQEGVTLFMTLLAGFQCLLSHYITQDDVLIAAPVSGRTRVETENLIGLFVNTVVLRNQLFANCGIKQLLERVRKTSLDVYSNQEVPFEMLVEELQPARNPGEMPFSQVMFVFQNIPEETLQVSGLKLRMLPPETEFAKFDLTLIAWEEDGQVVCSFRYKQQLFQPETIALLQSQLQAAFEVIANEPESSVGLLREKLDAIKRIYKDEQVSILQDKLLKRLASRSAG